MFSFSANTYISLIFLVVFTSLMNAKPIKIGMSADLSAENKSISEALLKGIQPTIKKINQKGGIKGRKLALIVLDDANQPEQAIQNTIKLIKKENVDILFSFTGTDTTFAAMPIIIKHNTPLFFPFSGAHYFHDGDIGQSIYHWRPNYFEETRALVRYLIKNKTNRIAVYYEKNSDGYSGLLGVKKALKYYRKKLNTTVSIDEKDNQISDFENDALLLLKNKPTAIICVTSPEASAGIIKAIRKTSNIPIATLSKVDYKTMNRLLENNRTFLNQLVVSQVVPTQRINKNYKYYKKTVRKPYDPIVYEGYLNTIRLMQLLKANSLAKLKRNHLKISKDLNRKHSVTLVKTTAKGWRTVK